MTQSQSWTPEAEVLTCCLGGSPCVQKLGCVSRPGACPALPHPHRVIGTHSLRETENQARLTRVAIQTRIGKEGWETEPDIAFCHRPEDSEDGGWVCVMDAPQTEEHLFQRLCRVFTCAFRCTLFPSFSM